MKNMRNVVKFLQLEHTRLTRQIEGISAALTAFGSSYKNGAGTGMSAAGRARIAAAQRARWAKLRATDGRNKVAAGPKRRTMSASARRKIAAAQRARWAKMKAH